MRKNPWTHLGCSACRHIAKTLAEYPLLMKIRLQLDSPSYEWWVSSHCIPHICIVRGVSMHHPPSTLSSTEWYHLTWCQRLCGVVRSRGHFYDLVLMAWAALVFISWKAIPWKKHQQNRPFICEAALMGGNALLCPDKPARLIWNSFSIFPQIFKSQNIEFKLWYSSVPAFQR